MKEINQEASVSHVKKAMEILQTLQTENETGEFHRDFMQARLHDIEQREALLKEELDRCEAERKDINKHSHDVGHERLRVRNKLARAAFGLLRNEEGIITNRALLWQIVAEQKLAHYEKTHAKEQYAVLLGAVDSTLRDAHAQNIAHPILLVEHNSQYNVGVGELELYETDVTSDGMLAFGNDNNNDRSVSIFLNKATVLDEARSPYDHKTSLEVPRFGLINYYNPSGQMTTIELDASKQHTTDLVIGAKSLNSYLDTCLDNDPTLLQAHVKRLAHQLKIRRSETLTELIMQHTIGEHISRFAADEFIAELTNKRLTLQTVADAIYLIRSPEDRQRLCDSVQQLANPQLQQIIASLILVHRISNERIE